MLFVSVTADQNLFSLCSFILLFFLCRCFDRIEIIHTFTIILIFLFLFFSVLSTLIFTFFEVSLLLPTLLLIKNVSYRFLFCPISALFILCIIFWHYHILIAFFHCQFFIPSLVSSLFSLFSFNSFFTFCLLLNFWSSFLAWYLLRHLLCVFVRTLCQPVICLFIC